MNPNSNEQRWSVVLSVRELCLNIMRKQGLCRCDAEEVFSEMLVRLATQEANGTLPVNIHRGFVLYCLHQVRIDFLRKRAAIRRGGGAQHLPLDEIAGDGPSVAFRFPDDNRMAALPMIDRLARKSNGRKRVLLIVIRRVIVTGKSVDSWAEAFTPAERKEFMGAGKEPVSEFCKEFVKQVSRTFSEILVEIRRINRSN
jgi:hypothetical protein